MAEVDPGAELNDLLSADRELTDEEMQQLQTLAEQEWDAVHLRLQAQAKRTYGVASPEDFSRCVQQHMQPLDYLEMLSCDSFTCPICKKLLKDREAPAGLPRDRPAKVKR